MDRISQHPDIKACKVNCEQHDYFATVWEEALAEITILKEKKQGEVIGVESVDRYNLSQWLSTDEYVGPTQIRRALAAGLEHIPELVIIFDEFDRLPVENRVLFADTIKELSDNNIRATVVIVGVAKNLSGLIADHASISRCLAQIEMPPMTREEVKEILVNGLSQLDMRMTNEAYETIVTLAQGYPHYTHLLGKHAVLSAINDRRGEVNTADVSVAITEALSDVGYDIADEYTKAILAQRKGTLFENVLLACALAKVNELGYFSSTDVAPVLSAITKKECEIYGFSKHLTRFASEHSRGPVLEKRGSSRCYQYRFVNPLLRPYAIIRGMSNGTVTLDALRRMEMPLAKKKRPVRTPHLIPTPKLETQRGLFDDVY